MVYYISNSPELFDGVETATIEDAYKYCHNRRVLGIDTETEGLFNHENKVIMLQIGDSNNQYVIDTRTVDISSLKPILENPVIIKVLANAKFDYKFFRMIGIMLNNIWDVQLAEMVLTTGLRGESVGLAATALKYLNKKLNKDIRNKFVGLNGRPFTLQQIKYGAEDVEVLLGIRLEQLKAIEKLELELVLYLENNFVDVLADIEYNGFYLNSEMWLKLFGANKQGLILARQALDEYVINNKHNAFIDHQTSLFGDAMTSLVNWDSPKQVIEYLKFLEIPTEVIVKGVKKDTCEEKHLKKFAKKHEFIPIYLNYKGIAKEVSTYGEKFLKNINKKTGRVHSDYWQIVSTGRISSSEPNLQNIPAREDENGSQPFRECFRAEEGKVLIVADYSQQEPRITADKSKDEALVEFYLNGDGDTHSMVASRMFSEIEGHEVKITKGDPRRQIGKVLNLKLDYGGSAYTVKDDLGTDEKDAQGFIDALKAAFPGKEKYFKEVIKNTLDKGYILIDDVTKRKSFVQGYDKYIKLQEELNDLNEYGINKRGFPWSEYYKLKGGIERAAKNYPIQGTGGSMTKCAAILLKKECLILGIYDKIKIVNLVHDEIVVEVPIDLASKVSKLLSKVMEQAGALFCKTVPMPADAVVCEYWMH